MRITDNQGCLCIVNEKHNLNSLVAEANKTESVETRLFLNRCNLINQNKHFDMIVPEGVEEILYKADRGNNVIQNLYLPSTLNKIQVFYGGAVYKKGCGLKIEIAPDNPFFASKNGSVYTKDYKELIYLAFSSKNKIEIDSRCERISDFVKVPIGKKNSLLKGIKEIGKQGVFIEKKIFRIPEGVENLHGNFFLTPNPKKRPFLLIPSTVISIKNINKTRVKVSKRNTVYASRNNCLYSKDFKTLFCGNKENLTVLDGCETVCLKDLLFSSINIPESVNHISDLEEFNVNVFITVSDDNQTFSSYKGSLYTKDFKKLLHLYVNKKSKEVYIHPSCTELDENYIPCRATLLRREKASEYKFIVPACFENQESLAELKDRIFGTKIYRSIEGIEKPELDILQIKRNLAGKNLWLQNYEYVNPEMVFPDNMKIFDYYYNPGQEEYIPILCSKDNLELSSDEEMAEVNIDGEKIQIDCRLEKIISMLNSKGYKTKFCCSGHLTVPFYFLQEEDGEPKVKARTLERNTINSVSTGYITFQKKYPEILKLFPKEKTPFVKSLRKLLGIKQSFENPVIYISSSKKNVFAMTLRFAYRPTREQQDKAMAMLEEAVEKITK